MVVGAVRVCSTPGCPNLHPGSGKCPACRARSDRARRPEGNPYVSRGHRRFRREVLTRDPVCVVCGQAPSTVADHYPHERRDLIAMGLDPDDPKFGRGVCASCHGVETARRTPAGWNERTR